VVLGGRREGENGKSREGASVKGREGHLSPLDKHIDRVG